MSRKIKKKYHWIQNKKHTTLCHNERVKKMIMNERRTFAETFNGGHMRLKINIIGLKIRHNVTFYLHNKRLQLIASFSM